MKKEKWLTFQPPWLKWAESREERSSAMCAPFPLGSPSSSCVFASQFQSAALDSPAVWMLHREPPQITIGKTTEREVGSGKGNAVFFLSFYTIWCLQVSLRIRCLRRSFDSPSTLPLRRCPPASGAEWDSGAWLRWFPTFLPLQLLLFDCTDLPSLRATVALLPNELQTLQDANTNANVQ